MKKSVLLLASLFLLSCTTDTEVISPNSKCNCGTITNIVTGGTVNGNTLMTYTVKNNCTAAISTIKKINTNGTVGDEMCN